jgi:hypothetical protein
MIGRAACTGTLDGICDRLLIRQAAECNFASSKDRDSFLMALGRQKPARHAGCADLGNALAGD